MVDLSELIARARSGRPLAEIMPSTLPPLGADTARRSHIDGGYPPAGLSDSSSLQPAARNDAESLAERLDGLGYLCEKYRHVLMHRASSDATDPLHPDSFIDELGAVRRLLSAD